MPPQRETFRHTASATLAVSEPGWPAVSSIATRTGDAVAHLAHGVDAVDRLLDELEARRGEREDRGDGLVDLPGAVGVQAQLHLAAGRRAHGGHAAGVVADADLDLHARVARVGGGGRLLGGVGAVLGRDRRVDADLGVRVVGDQLADRLALAVAGEVPEREVDRGQRLGHVGHDAAALEQVRGGVAVAVAQDRPRRPRTPRAPWPARRRRRAPAAPPRPSRRRRRRRAGAGAAARACAGRRMRSASGRRRSA